jgi:histidinol-phosphate aminotransferase
MNNNTRTKKEKNNNSLSRKIASISRLGAYSRPEKIQGAIKLDSNENFVLDRELVSRIAVNSAKVADIREYPIEELDALHKRLSRYTGINQSCIAAGSGSDQIIELLLSTLGGTRATVFYPTFSYFVNRCELHGIKVDQVSLQKDFSLDMERFTKSVSKADLVYICSPNNPTANQFDETSVKKVIDSVRKNTLVLIDEAYVDFASHSVAEEMVSRENVIVLRTLSKAFGLAGARVGYMLANERLAETFRTTIQSPYPISTLSLVIAASMLDNTELVKKTIETIVRERNRMMRRLSAISGIKTNRSDANFIFLETGDNYEGIAKRFAEKSILVKMLGNIAGHKGCMRITVGTPDINDLVLECVEGVCS